MGATWSDSRPLPEGSLPPRYGTVEQQRHAKHVELRAELVDVRGELTEAHAALERLHELIGMHRQAIEEPRVADWALWGPL